MNSILHLQRTIGNHAVERLLQSNAEDREAGSAALRATRFMHDFSRIPLFAKAWVNIQPKLTTSTSRDIYGQEADHVAEQVEHMPNPQLEHACACGGGCPKCKKEKGSNEELPTKRVQGHVTHETSGDAAVSSTPLSPETACSSAHDARLLGQGGHPSRLPNSSELTTCNASLLNTAIADAQRKFSTAWPTVNSLAQKFAAGNVGNLTANEQMADDLSQRYFSLSIT